MSWRNLLTRNKADREWREELEAHIEMATDAFLAEGMTPEEARSAALKQAGNLTARLEEIYQMNGIGWLDSLSSDLRYALRGLRHHPSFTATAVLTLALGIGANTAVFSVVNSVLLKPIAYPEPARLVDLAQVAPGAGGIIGSRGLALSPSMYFTYSEQNQSFQAMGAWTRGTVTVTGLAEPEQVFADEVTDGVLQALAVQPEVGRPLNAADQAPGSADTVLLTYGYWQRRFGGDRSVVGRKIVIDARPREVAGVMPEGFRIADMPADLILPLKFDRSRSILAGFYLSALGRLKPGVSIQQANADIARLLPIWVHMWPFSVGEPNGDPRAESVYLNSWRIAPNVRPLRDRVVGNVSGVLWVIMGTLAMVMLIACANVANLLLVRVEARQQELAVRAALGAGWGRIARQLLVESVLLGVAGGALGLGLAYAGLRLLVRSGPSNLPRLSEIALDSRALAFTVIVSLLSGLIFGLIPAVRYALPRVSLSLRGGGRTMSQSRESHRARNTLVVVQVSLALVLLICSGLMIRTFYAVRHVQLGFADPASAQTFRIAIPNSLVPSEEETTRMENTIADKIAAIPGVMAVGFASALPMDGTPPNWDGILPEGQSYAAGNRPPMRFYSNVSPGFFHALGARLIAGRELTWTDIYSDHKFVLISENLARELWGSAPAAIGKRVRSADVGPWREVAGVVEDIRHSGAQEPAPASVYWPIFGQIPYGPIKAGTRYAVYSVRTNRAGTGAFLDEVRQAVWSVNAALPVANPETMADIAGRSMARTSFTLVMLSIAGVMALMLGLIGIYGVIAYAVTQRTREIGIRLALGAESGDVRRMFVRYGLGLCVIGIAIGLGAAAGLTRLMKSLLFGVASMDPITFAAVPLALLLAAIAACYLPARRVSSVNPVECMRAE